MSVPSNCVFTEDNFLQILTNLTFKEIIKFSIKGKEKGCFTEFVIKTLYKWYQFDVITSEYSLQDLSGWVVKTYLGDINYFLQKGAEENNIDRVKTSILNGADKIKYILNQISEDYIDGVHEFVNKEIIDCLTNNIHKDISYKKLNKNTIDVIIKTSVITGNFKKVRHVLDDGANADFGLQYTMHSPTEINLNLVKLLVDKGADPKKYDDNYIVLASKNGNLEVVKYLISLGLDPKINDNQALLEASYAGHLNIVKYLLNGYSDLNNFALNEAIQGDNLKIVKFLEYKGVDLHQDEDEALVVAVMRGYLDMIKFLINKGLNVNTQQGIILSSIVTLICIENKDIYYDILKYLLKRGIEITDEAIDIAKNSKCGPVLKLLRGV